MSNILSITKVRFYLVKKTKILKGKVKFLFHFYYFFGIEMINYKQGIETMQVIEPDFEKLPILESEENFFLQLFSDFTSAFEKNEVDTFIELLKKLCHMIFENQSDFNNFTLNSTNLLIIFFNQCFETLDNINDEGKEAIIFYFKEMIKNISFSNSFSDFKGDLILVNFYRNISENVDKYILDILYKMKLSSEFPISTFREYFQFNINNFEFIMLFLNCMDKSLDINALFQEFVMFPPPQMQSFSLICKVIISFFQHSLSEQIFVESHYYDLIFNCFQSDMSDENIGLFLQITARLLDYDEILSQINPILLFSLLKFKKSKSIIVPAMIIIYSLIKKEENMDSSDFMDKYIDETIILVLMDNLQNESFLIRIRSLCLLNLFIDKSNFKILQHMFQLDKQFMEIISQTILDFLSADDNQIIISALELAHSIFTYIQRTDNSNLIKLLSIWQENGICSINQDFIENECEITDHARILNDKIKNNLILINNII